MTLETGKYISQELQAYIDLWTSMDEQKEICVNHDYSIEIGRKLVRRERKITEGNRPLLIDTIRKAISNRTYRMVLDKKTHKKALKSI